VTALDGNAMAGDLREVFAADVTTALFTCAGCGHAGAVATLELYRLDMGTIARCPGCTDVVLRIVRLPGRVALDLRGAVRLEISNA
jgi:hypothetical protein